MAQPAIEPVSPDSQCSVVQYPLTHALSLRRHRGGLGFYVSLGGFATIQNLNFKSAFSTHGLNLSSQEQEQGETAYMVGPTLWSKRNNVYNETMKQCNTG